MKNKTLYISSILLGILCFLCIFGIHILNPFYSDWLLIGEDLTQHFMGWEFFRISNWQFPLGLMDKISYPNSVSIIFTDSIPLFAVLFKALSPIFIMRTFYHTALSSQWLLLVALYVGLKTLELHNAKKLYLYWVIIGVLSASIHLYYIPMCGIIMLGFLLVKSLKDKSLKELCITIALYCFSTVCIIYLWGGFSHDHQLDAGGLGQFSFNMNGFFNSMGHSKFFPPLSSYGEGSSDGFSYLGLGGLILLFIVLLSILYKSVKDRKLTVNKNLWLACIFICIISFLVSASHKLAINADYVIELPYPQKLVSLWGMFRSSGRFIWPVIYIIMLYLIVRVYKMFQLTTKGTFIAMALIIVCFLIQIYDISPLLASKHNEFSNKHTYESALQSTAWDVVAKNKDHIIFTLRVNQNQGLLYMVSQFAYTHNITINDFYLSHSALDSAITENIGKSMENLQDNVIYIFRPEDNELCQNYELNYYLIDNLIVGLKQANPKLNEFLLN